jgi:hypothetical protein
MVVQINFFLWDIEDYIVYNDKGFKGILPFTDFINISFEDFAEFRDIVEKSDKYLKLKNNVYIQKIDEDFFNSNEE